MSYFFILFPSACKFFQSKKSEETNTKDTKKTLWLLNTIPYKYATSLRLWHRRTKKETDLYGDVLNFITLAHLEQNFTLPNRWKDGVTSRKKKEDYCDCFSNSNISHILGKGYVGFSKCIEFMLSYDIFMCGVLKISLIELL